MKLSCTANGNPPVTEYKFECANKVDQSWIPSSETYIVATKDMNGKSCTCKARHKGIASEKQSSSEILHVEGKILFEVLNHCCGDYVHSFF